jgi:hypothetical protein
VKSTSVSLAEARRIAVRSQLLDGSATSVLETVRRLGFLQIDPISTIAPPQHLVLWSRLGAFDPAELDRLLWQERKLFEWGAFIRPIEDLPLIMARMKRRRGTQMYEIRGAEFLKTNARFKRHLLRELEHRGPLLSREIEADLMVSRDPHDWWGSRKVGLMLELLEGRGIVAVVGRRGKQRLWDLAERWYPPVEKISWPDARKILEERRWRARPGPNDVPVAVRPADPRSGPHRSVVPFLLPARDVRAQGEAAVRLLRAADPARRPADRAHRSCLRPKDRGAAGQLRALGTGRQARLAREASAGAREVRRRR